MKNGKLYKMLNFTERKGSVGGALVQFQPGSEMENALPFDIAKVLLMYDIVPGDVRGRHAHYKTEEIFTVLQGSCVVDLDNGKGIKESVCLTADLGDESSKAALLLYPHVWREVRDFAPNTTLLAVVSTKHDERDYIRDYESFLKEADQWSDLGGSDAED